MTIFNMPTSLLVTGVLLIALFIGFLCFLGYGVIYGNRLRRIQVQMAKFERRTPPGEFKKLFANDHRLAHLWKEYEDSLHEQHEERDGQRVVIAVRATVPAETYFSSQFVVDSRLGTEFFKHLPGIFTGLGIIGTFTGLIDGLNHFQVSEDAATVRASLESLMHSVGEAFLISAAAITAAMVVTFLEKLLVAWLYRHTEEIAHKIDACFDSGAGEEYLSRLVDASEDSASQSKILKDALVKDLGAMLSQITKFQVNNSEKLIERLAERFDRAVERQGAVIGEKIREGLQGPIEEIAIAVKTASGDQSSETIRMLNDVMVSFSQRLNDLFGGQITGINDLNKQTAQGMQQAVSALNSLVAKLEASGKKSTGDMAAQMAAAVQSMEEGQARISAQIQAFVEQIGRVIENSQTETQQKLQVTLESVGHQMTTILTALSDAQGKVLEENRVQEKAMVDRAQVLVNGMTQRVVTAVEGMATASKTMAQSVATLSQATTSSISQLNAGAERMNNAASSFATAGERVSGVMGQTETIGTQLTEASHSLTTGAGAVADGLRDYRAQREAMSQLWVNVRATVERAHKEAGLTNEVLIRIDSSTSKLGEAQKKADEHLEGVNQILAKSSQEFRELLQASVQSTDQQMTTILTTLSDAQGKVLEENRVREKAMLDRAQVLVNGMTQRVVKAVEGMATASNTMAETVSTLSGATTASIDKLDTAAGNFATAGDRVSGVMNQAAAIGTKLAEVSSSLTAGAGAIGEALGDYRAQREAMTKLLANIRETIELARKEAGFTTDVLKRIEYSTSKLGEAQKQADEYLDGVSQVLVESNKVFQESVVNTLGKVNHEFHNKLSSAVGLLSSAVQELEVTLSSLAPRR